MHPEILQRILNRAVRIGQEAERENKKVTVSWVPPSSPTDNPAGSFIVYKQRRGVTDSW